MRIQRGFNKRSMRMGLCSTLLVFHVICLAEANGNPYQNPFTINENLNKKPHKNNGESIRNQFRINGEPDQTHSRINEESNQKVLRKKLGIHPTPFQNQWRIRSNISKTIEIHPKPSPNQWSITANPFQNQR